MMNTLLHNYYTKSIRLTPDGFSLYNLSEENGQHQAHYPISENALISNKAPVFFDFEKNTSQPIEIIVATRMPLLVPDIIYDASKDKDYLRLQFDISQFGQSYNESLGHYRSLFFLTQNEYSTLNELPCQATFKSEVSIFYDFLIHQQVDNAVLLSLNETFADFIAVQKGEPLLVNRTKHVEQVDILYYTINCMQQLGMESPTLFVQNFQSQNKKLNDLLSQYLDNIIFL